MQWRRSAVASGVALAVALIVADASAADPVRARCDAAAAGSARMDDGTPQSAALTLLDARRQPCEKSSVFIAAYSRLLARAQRYGDAYSLLDAARDRGVLADIEYLRERAWVDARAGQYDSAIAAGRGMIAQWPEWSDGYWLVAGTLHLQGRTADADAVWREYHAVRSRVATGAWVRSLDRARLVAAVVGVLMLGVGGGLLAGWGLRRARRIGALPAAVIRSAAPGYVQLKGMAQAEGGRLLHSPRTATPCLWYDYTELRRTLENGRERTHVVARRTAGIPFLLRDARAELTIDPDGAEFSVRTRKVECFGTSTHHEALIMEGESVYAIGRLSSHRLDGGPRRHRLARPIDERRYLLSTHSEERQLLAARFAAAVGVVTLVVALAALAWLAQQRWWVDSLPMPL